MPLRPDRFSHRVRGMRIIADRYRSSALPSRLRIPLGAVTPVQIDGSRSWAAAAAPAAPRALASHPMITEQTLVVDHRPVAFIRRSRLDDMDTIPPNLRRRPMPTGQGPTQPRSGNAMPPGTCGESAPLRGRRRAVAIGHSCSAFVFLWWPQQARWPSRCRSRVSAACNPCGCRWRGSSEAGCNEDASGAQPAMLPDSTARNLSGLNTCRQRWNASCTCPRLYPVLPDAGRTR